LFILIRMKFKNIYIIPLIFLLIVLLSIILSLFLNDTNIYKRADSQIKEEFINSSILNNFY
jgi:carbon starvation protein CstA